MSWRHSITARLSLAFALLAVAVFGALSAYLGRSVDGHMAELDADDLRGKLALIHLLAQREPDAAGMASRLREALAGEHGIAVAVRGAAGSAFDWPDAERAAAILASARPTGGEPVEVAAGGTTYRVVADRWAAGWGEQLRVAVGRDIHHHTDFLARIQRDLRLAVLAACLLTVALGVLIARRGLRPVRDMTQAAGRISVGSLAERIPEQGVPPELAGMVHAFNAMLARLEASFTRLSDFSADLAHELRTPIHALRMQTEVSLGQTRTAAEYRELLAANLEEYDRLARVIADMLFLAKADHGLIVPQRESVPLKALCERLIDYYGLLAADGVDIRLQGDDAVLTGDRLMLERAIGNVLLNAIHHTPAGGRIGLRLEHEGGAAVVAIRNSGEPIPPEAVARLFERFVRLDARREGNGLGLAIARSIVEAHGGGIAVEAVGQGAEFRLRFPLAEGSTIAGAGG